MKKKIGVYIRVSSYMQKSEGGSIEFQRDRGSKYCIDNGYDFELFEDVMSGDKVERKGMNVLFEKIYNNELDGFWLYDWNRLIRDKSVGVMFEKMLYDNKDCIVIENNNVKDIVNDYGDRVNYEVNGFVSSIFLHNLRKNVKDGSIKKLKDGKVLRKLKMGYSKVKDEVVLNEDSKIVKEMFRVFLFKSIKSKHDLTKYINEKYDKKYNNSMIMRWLEYKGYNGLIRQKYLDFEIDTKIPKIIDDKLFLDVQNKIKSIYGRRKGRDSSDYLLKGLVYCGCCGKKMYKYGSTNRKNYKKNKDGSLGKKYGVERKYVRDFHYYKCSVGDYKKVNESEEEYNIRMNSCKSYKKNSINFSMLDGCVWSGLFKFLNESDYIKKGYSKKSSEERSRLGKNIGKKRYYKEEIEKLKNIKKETYKDWKLGKINEEDFNEFNNSFNEEIDNNNNRLKEIENYKIVNIDDDVIDNYLEVMKLDLDNKRRLGDKFFGLKRLENESDESFYKRKNGSLKDMKRIIDRYIRKIYVKRIGENEYNVNFEFSLKLFDNEKMKLVDNLIKEKNNLLYINSLKVYKWISYIEEKIWVKKFRFSYFKIGRKWDRSLYSFKIEDEEVNII